MRRFALMVAAALPLFTVTGCEDGPNQTFNPAPSGAAGVWNGPGSNGIPEGGTYVNQGSQNYDASFGGQNANISCTADQAKSIWTNMFSMPIEPPGLASGIDMAGGVAGDGNANYVAGMPFNYDETKETWVGATVEQAEKILCTAIDTSDDVFTGVTSTAGWGESCPLSCEVNAFYYPNSRKIHDLIMQPGYTGAMNATSADGTTKYSLVLNNQPMTMSVNGGSPTDVTLDWFDTTGAFVKVVNQIYDAYRNTYAHSFPPDKDCTQAGHCIIGNNKTQGGYLWFTPIQVVIFVSNTLAPQPAASTWIYIDLPLLKLLPFSTGNNLMKLDADGPLSITSNVANGGTTCTYKLGMTFNDFNTQCVAPPSVDAKDNAINEKKLLGAMAHTDEAYEFNIQGVDPQFAAASQPDNSVIGDTQTPASNDIAYQYTVDQNVLGPISNDWQNDDPTTGMQDLHGIGMITLETAYLVQQYMKANYGVTADLGDPTCIANPASETSAGVDGGAPTHGCSGLEGIVTSAPTTALAGLSWAAQGAVNAIGPAAATVDPNIGVGLKPSTWAADFCTTSGTAANPTAYAGCEGGSHGGPLGGNYFDSFQWAVSQSFGANPVPDDVASRRFYFKNFILASIKYFQAVGAGMASELSLSAVDAEPIDDNEVFFDSAGGGFENGNYVFRGQVNAANQPPTFFNVATNLTTSVLNNFSFARYNFRGDLALSTVLNTNPSDKPGAEPLYIQNLAGSPVLTSVYGGGQAGYTCAIADTAAKVTAGMCPQIAPDDPLTGQPQFAPYAAAFGQSFMNIAPLGVSVSNSPITVTPGPYELIQSAMVTIPIWKNPFDPTSGDTGNNVSVLLAYLPAGAGGGGEAGFPVTLDGSRDKFYNTNELYFTSIQNLGNGGGGLDITMDYEYVGTSTPDGGVLTQTVVRALESQAYIGEIMACAATGPSGNKDVLAVRMYDNVTTIYSWLADHPGAATNCGLQTKYSIYGNYADYISFNNNGIRLGFNPGFGGSVVSDGTIFDANIIGSLGQ